MATSKGTGWVPQQDETTDKIYVPPHRTQLPDKVDLRDTHFMQLKAYDQRQLGSCTSQAIASALKYGKNAAGKGGARFIPYDPSRLFIYWHERIMGATGGELVPPSELQKYLDGANSIKTVTGKSVSRQDIENSIFQDDGAQIRDGMRALKKYGVCWERTWPYMPSDYSDGEAKQFTQTPWYGVPPPNALTEALTYINPAIIEYSRIKDLGENVGRNLIAHMEAAIAEGFPVVFGFWGSDENANLSGGATLAEQGLTEDYEYKGFVKDTDTGLWGHAVLACGYDRKKQRFTILNSWGETFGDSGYFYMPYKWFAPETGMFKRKGKRMTPRADDFWVIKSYIPQGVSEATGPKSRL